MIFGIKCDVLMMLFSQQQLRDNLTALTVSKKLLIAYSGGLDSHVVLHALATLPPSQGFQVRALYIDHGLQAIAKQWPQHCLTVCKALGVDCDIVALNLTLPKGESLEAVARKARYYAFAQQLQQDEVLITAHHQDDQAETVLIQLFRGAGVNGLAAMPSIKAFAKGVHVRPLLDQSRQALAQYAKHYALNYIDDPSNQAQCYDRNFLRHSIIPQLKNRWQSINAVLGRVTQHQAEAKHLLAEYLQQDMPLLTGRCHGTLSIQKLKQLSEARCKAVIRFFLAQKGFLAPSEKKLRHILSDVLDAQPSASPCVHWQGVEVRRYQDDVYAIKPLSQHNAQQIIYWNIAQPLQLPQLNKILNSNQLDAIYPLLKKDDPIVEVRFRQGGETLYQADRKRTKSLKKIFQEMQVPVWERARIPLIYIDKKLVLLIRD
jgi:tRNA(Ile)-lysidine synthase